MMQYIGMEAVHAKAESRVNGKTWSAGEEIPSGAKLERGYRIMHADGHESWLPIDAFEKVYRPADGLTFGLAIEAMKKGLKVRRRGWNGKNQYIELASGISYKNPEGIVVNAQHDAIGNQAVAFCGTSGVQMGWLASQADMLSEDWEVVEDWEIVGVIAHE